jgi:hypothetical protein
MSCVSKMSVSLYFILMITAELFPNTYGHIRGRHVAPSLFNRTRMQAAVHSDTDPDSREYLRIRGVVSKQDPT